MKSKYNRMKAIKKSSVMEGMGREYSAVALEIEQTFHKWINASDVSELDFFKLIDREDICLTFQANDEMALAALLNSKGEIAMPLIWQEGNGISFKSYKTDTALLLLFVAGKCNNPKSQKKIELFVKEKIFPK